MTRIGFVGLGVMGSRMAKRLIDSGYDVTVYNRTSSKIEPLLRIGAAAATDIASLAAESDIICTCLSMPEDVWDVYEGETGILKNSLQDAICLDFTTVGMDTSVILAEKAKERGIHFLDAPVSGGPEGAEEGSLTIMVGGEQSAYERVLPILEVLGSNIHYLGGAGMGSVAKLMNQYLVAVHSLAASEVMVAGTALGLRSEQLYEILRTSYGDSRMLRRHMENYVLPRNFQPGGAVKYVLKDVKLANELVEKAGLVPRTGSGAAEALAVAVEQGLADLDMSAVIQPLEKQCSVVVKDSHIV
ncbi:NAD(P)-dependent oxidoreductase [Effusibacillus lacus]|uniref:3-hydroxyisobutyrate dehydrogenase n=1 Tax=Effusibacillus lacus TaxID=1348429 RepID=A0A292YKV8_9BACL|nr:NAD(P)-dependent oxidoreductase [Effusibacillus lacus]TCS75375.1 3-hydroxyisobutyrate dehydrogenase [Effusibacillus lacus]GAX89806.1 3-hydroxyisobutyrate dehydrogenase [Effusibacillus lacus]